MAKVIAVVGATGAQGGGLVRAILADKAGGFTARAITRNAGSDKAQALKQLGVEEYFIVQEEGTLRWALSLGVFRTEEAAQARLAALRGQGVRSARVGVRDTTVPKVWLQVKGVDAALQARLKEIARQVEGTELKDCP